ncbi:MAG: DUF11 domain-containing protein [Anaerolineales bacterium]|nr:DUF11 domain-containing protein [Anaerolineales bacterium]
MLVGLISLAGLVYRAGTVPAQAAGQLLESSWPALAAPVNAIQAQAQITAQETITPLDVVVVFDISGSTEDETICHDCWVRTSYNPNWPNNGYFNPIPYNKVWKDTAPGGPAATGNQSIPHSALCTVYPPRPFITNTFQYLAVEAELYSAVGGGWGLDVRTPGNGFWSIQRGTRGSSFSTFPLNGEPSRHKNAAGDPINQSSNVCRPNVEGNEIDCTVGNAGGSNGDNVCSSADGGVVIDCSAFIAARPMATYGQMPGDIPNLAGASYNSNCFINSGGTGSTGGDCWSNNPFNSIPGLERGPSTVPYVEYDFTPTWSEPTSIWLRVIGGGERSYTWAGPSPDQILPDLNGSGLCSGGMTRPECNNITPWRKVIYWQVSNGTIFQRKDNLNADYSNSPTENMNSNNTSHMQRYDDWYPNRANSGMWRWIKLGSTTTVSGTQSTFRLYQGSAGYMVDKIVFTNDPNGNTPERGGEITTMTDSTIPAALRRRADGAVQTSGFNGSQTEHNAAWRDSLGPPASLGSATREACNVCNPAFGYTVDPAQCSCKLTANDTANGGYGSGAGCTQVTTVTNQLTNDLYSGLQPLRGAQEAVKNLARKLNPQCDQLGFVPFTGDTINSADRRSKLQCLNWSANQLGNPGRCYDPGLGTPISYTNIINAVEKQWPEGGTNISLGLREGLEELGIMTPGNPTPVNSGICTPNSNDGNACDRGSAARRVLILLTDGSPNENTNSASLPAADRTACAPGSGRPDLWDGILGTEDPDFECSMYYAFLAAQNNVTLYTIGIGGGVNSDLLSAMATGTDPRSGGEPFTHFVGKGGQYFPAARPSDLEAIFDTIVTPSASCQFSPPTLTLTQTGAPDPVKAGEVLTYTISVTSSGTANSAGVIITGVLDSNVSFASASNGGLHHAGVVTWNVGVMLPGQTITRTVAVTIGNVVSGTVLSNAVSTTSNGGFSASTTITTSVISATGVIGPPWGPIWALNYRVLQLDTLPVHLENHLSPAGPFDIYLSQGTPQTTFKVCASVNTNPATNNGDFDCFISGAIPPGFYSLYSTLSGDENPLDVAPLQVEIAASSPPQIVIDNGAGGNIAAVNSSITITLVAHQVPDQPFDLYFVSPTDPTGLKLFTDVLAIPASPLTWQLPGSLLNPSNPCPAGGPTPCLIQSRDQNDQVYASGEFYLNSPEIVLAGGVTMYAPGEFMYMALRGHTPGLAYDLKFSDELSNTVWLGRTGITNANGDTPSPIAWTIPITWPDGVYTITSHPVVGGTPRDPASMTSANQIGSLSNIQINTPTASANLQITAPDQVQPGGAFTYTITVANTGSAAATGVVVSDILDGRVGFVAASDNGQHQNGIVTWNVGGLPAGQTITRTLAVTVGNFVSGTLLSNTVWVTSTEGISASQIITTAVFKPATPPGSTYLPVILKP